MRLEKKTAVIYGGGGAIARTFAREGATGTSPARLRPSSTRSPATSGRPRPRRSWTRWTRPRWSGTSPTWPARRARSTCASPQSSCSSCASWRPRRGRPATAACLRLNGIPETATKLGSSTEKTWREPRRVSRSRVAATLVSCSIPVGEQQLTGELPAAGRGLGRPGGSGPGRAKGRGTRRPVPARQLLRKLPYPGGPTGQVTAELPAAGGPGPKTGDGGRGRRRACSPGDGVGRAARRE